MKPESCLTRRLALAALVLVAQMFGLHEQARAEFAMAIAPPRIEAGVKPGEVLRRVLDLTNAAPGANVLSVRTMDWIYAQDGTVSFKDELQPGSCRPWVAIERRQVTISGNKNYRFRFEVTPPASTPVTECRFAIMFEGQEEKTQAGGISIPFSAGIAVIVYVAVGDAKPLLSVEGMTRVLVNGQMMPAVKILNSGQAHGRLGGILEGEDAAAQVLDFTPSTSPILPGETRDIPLLATLRGDADTPVKLKYPVKVRGRLEWAPDVSKAIDLTFDQP